MNFIMPRASLWDNPAGYSLANTPRQSVALPLSARMNKSSIRTGLSRGDLRKVIMPVCHLLKFYFKSRRVFAPLAFVQKLKILLQQIRFRRIVMSPSLREYPGGGREVKVSLQKLKILLQQIRFPQWLNMEQSDVNHEIPNQVRDDGAHFVYFIYSPAALSGVNYFEK